MSQNETVKDLLSKNDKLFLVKLIQALCSPPAHREVNFQELARRVNSNFDLMSFTPQ